MCHPNTDDHRPDVLGVQALGKCLTNNLPVLFWEDTAWTGEEPANAGQPLIAVKYLSLDGYEHGDLFASNRYYIS